jgi:hypothetical protein
MRSVLVAIVALLAFTVHAAEPTWGTVLGPGELERAIAHRAQKRASARGRAMAAHGAVATILGAIQLSVGAALLVANRAQAAVLASHSARSPSPSPSTSTARHEHERSDAPDPESRSPQTHARDKI